VTSHTLDGLHPVGLEDLLPKLDSLPFSSSCRNPWKRASQLSDRDRKVGDRGNRRRSRRKGVELSKSDDNEGAQRPVHAGRRWPHLVPSMEAVVEPKHFVIDAVDAIAREGKCRRQTPVISWHARQELFDRLEDLGEDAKICLLTEREIDEAANYALLHGRLPRWIWAVEDAEPDDVVLYGLMPPLEVDLQEAPRVLLVA
jgi:hypothetical protein